MNIALSDTILYVTGKQGIENTTQQELQTMVADYPYFAPAQLAYTAKLKSDNSFKLQTQIQKAGLFFNNFKWLQYQMMEVNEGGFSSSVNYNGLQEKVREALIEENKKQILIEEPDETLAFEIFEKEEDEGVKNDDQTTLTPIINSENTALEKTIEDETIAHNYADFMPNISIPTVEDVKGIMNGIDEKYESNTATNIGEGNLINEEFFIANELQEPDVETASQETIIEDFSAIIDSDETNNNFEAKLENESSATVFEENKITGFEILEPEEFILPPAPINDIHAEIAALKANWYKRKETEEQIIEQEKTIETNKTIEEVNFVENNHKNLEPKTEAITSSVDNVSENKLSNQIAAIKNEFNKPTTSLANEPLPFETEPYYTIDYFASQGIKFDINKSPQDKLTAKMLKFTDWLKKMKTTKPEINVMVDDPELDKAIQNIAATSNQSKEVVTETMAEIFAKQGKKEKAIQLYIKLSFLIPDKSSYFADKIKELKGI